MIVSINELLLCNTRPKTWWLWCDTTVICLGHDSAGQLDVSPAGVCQAHSCICGHLPFHLGAGWSRGTSARISPSSYPAASQPSLLHMAVGAKSHRERASLSALFKPLLVSHLILFIGQSKSCGQPQRECARALS